MEKIFKDIKNERLVQVMPILVLLLIFSLFLIEKAAGWRLLNNHEIAYYDWSYLGFSVEELLKERGGFGKAVTGGLYGRIYHVTTLADSGPGSLREAAEKEEALWIVFDLSGIINLKKPIYIRSNKTIDGRGRTIVITGYGLKIRSASNVIITNIRFDTAEAIDMDAIEIRDSHTIWIHHCDITNYSDGAIDIVGKSTNVTISWCRFWNHDKVMAIGNPEFEDTKVTLHHNFFYRTVQRTPRVCRGKVDIYNNYFFGWQFYAVGVERKGELLIEANIFEAEKSTRAVGQLYNEEPEKWGYIRLLNNKFLNGALAQENEPEKVFNRLEYYEAVIEAADDLLKERIMAFSGVQANICPQIMTDHKLTYEDFRWKTPTIELIYAGDKINLYAIIPPPRNFSEEIVSYNWDFGDGRLSSGIFVSHTYRDAGVYYITLTLIKRSGDSLSVTKKITVISEGPLEWAAFLGYWILFFLVAIIAGFLIFMRFSSNKRILKIKISDNTGNRICQILDDLKKSLYTKFSRVYL